MEQRERVLAALDGHPVDRVPLVLWKHNHRQSQTAEGLAQATVDFGRRYHPDLLVLTPSPLYLAQAWSADVRSFNDDNISPYIAGALVARATDWRTLPDLEIGSSSLRREIEAVRRVRAELGRDVPLILPLYSPLTTADQLSNGRIVGDLRSFSNDVRAGLATIASVTRAFAQACLSAGADGCFFVKRPPRRGVLRVREQRDFGQRFDLEVLEPLAQSAIRILFLEGDRPPLELADRYPVQAVCWETWRSSPSIADAQREMRCGIMGGINPMTLVDGSVQEVHTQVQVALEQSGGWHLILAPTGPLLPRSRDDLVAAVHRAIRAQGA